MGYYVSTMIGIRLGGVFSNKTDMDDLKNRIAKIIREMDAEAEAAPYGPVASPDLGDKNGDPSHCLSRELTAHKGSYAVIAGVFNYWSHNKSFPFAAQLSKEFGTEVMIMAWDEEINEVQCQIFLDGKPLFEVLENPIGQILRRIC